MIRMLAFLIILPLLAACTADNEDALSKVEEVFENAPAKLEVEATDEDEAEAETLKFIEFDLEEENIQIDIKKVLILKEYLNGLKNTDDVISDMNLEKFEISDKTIFLLSFSCVDDRCSYLLFDENQDKRTYLLADMAQFSNIIPSPDKSRIAIIFNRTIEDRLPVNNVVMFDLANWKTLPLYNYELPYNILNYKWPIVSVDWVDEEHVSISVPEIVDLNKDTYDEWSTSETNSVQSFIYQLYEE